MKKDRSYQSYVRLNPINKPLFRPRDRVDVMGRWIMQDELCGEFSGLLITMRTIGWMTIGFDNVLEEGWLESQ